MAQLIKMPKLSDTMEEGGIASWLKKEGDAVKEGEPLVEIETDKATMEYASPEGGILLKIIATPGGSYPLQAPIAVIGAKGEAFDLGALSGGAQAGAAKMGAPAAPQGAMSLDDKRASMSAASVSPPSMSLDDTSSSRSRIKASPLAKKMAKEKGVSLASLRGSGPHGRIIAQDVVQSGATGVSGHREVPVHSHTDTRIPLSMMRKTISKRLVAAKSQAPHFYLTVSADMEKALAWRNELNAHPKVVDKTWGKVSVNDLVLFAVARALRLHPEVNASWQEDAIVQWGAVHVAMAVALPGGLITPVISHADQMGIRELAIMAKSMGKKAHEGVLSPQDYEGGTFTVSNLGMTLVEEFTAIINPPQAAILAVGRVQKVPVVAKDDTLSVGQRMKMTLSCDHRVIDGLVGAQFLETLVRFLEEPVRMLE